jgi:hypothetical protein
VAAWLIPSYFNAERYRRRLEAGLERELHRPVTFGEVSVRLLPRPGFVIENALIQEDPAFGSEPFARVDRIECDIRWQTLLGARLDFSHFRLQHPNINLVQKSGGGWNVERLLLRSSAPSGASRAGSSSSKAATHALDFEVEDGRVNFKLGENKKPFAITDLRAQIGFDPADNRLRFRLLGYPVRTELSLPTPGPVEVTGDWAPGKDLRGPLDATVRLRGALLYNWAPLVIGRNTGLYGVMDCEMRVTGSIRALNFEGSGLLSELHQWERIPPSDHMPWNLTFRGQLDRDRGRVQLETLEASFAASHLHLSGTIDYFAGSPELDLVIGLERSRLEDLAALARRLWTIKEGYGIRGRVDGMLTIQGPWAQRRYGGFVGAREVVLSTRSASFPVSDIAVRIDNRGAHLAPVRITLAPHVTLEAEGSLDRTTRLLPYELTLSTKVVPLRDVLNFGRALGLRGLQGWDAEGSGSAAFHLMGSVRLPSRPILKGRAELRAARLVIPGFTEPLNLPRASLRVSGDQVIIDPVLAVLGTSVFSGRLEHQGGRQNPWAFDLRADNLSLDQGALWFVALGRRQPIPLLQRLPGLGSFATSREAASNLFAALNARGTFATPKVTFRNVALSNLRTDVEVAGRVIRVGNATFRVGGGEGRLSGRVDLTGTPARLAADVLLSGVGVQSLVTHLPPALRGAHGLLSVKGHFEATGLSHEEMRESLEGGVTLVASDLSLVGFDPVGEFVRLEGEGALEPFRGATVFRSVTLNLQVHDGRVVLKKTTLESAGARLNLSAAYAFDGRVNLRVGADLQHLRRRWLTRVDGVDRNASPRELNFSGPLDKLELISDTEVSHANR